MPKRRKHRKWKRELLKREIKRLKRELEEKDKQLKQTREVVEQKDKQLEEKEEELEQTREELEMLTGTFYSSIDEVWGICMSRSNESENKFLELCRDKCPDLLARPDIPHDTTENVYEWTKTCAYQSSTSAADDPGSRSRSSLQSARRVWPTDIFGNKNCGQLAHLVPATPLHATLYTDVARCTLAVHHRHRWRTLQKMIHGSKKTSRLPHTGIKHLVANRIRLAAQADFLDNAPCILIVPVMSLEAMKKWNGEKYDAVVMVGAYKDEEKDISFTVQDVCRRVQMSVLPEENDAELKDPSVPFNVRYCIADEEQVELARRLLVDVLLGLADSLLRRLPKIKGKLDKKQKEKLTELQGHFSFGTLLRLPKAKVKSDPEAKVKSDPEVESDPKVKVKEKPLRVRLVSFGDYASSEGRHPAPDPLLLAIRAGITWSWRHGQKLLAAAEPQDDDIERDELYELAIEQYLDFCDAQCRPKTWDDVARGLGQERGWVA